MKIQANNKINFSNQTTSKKSSDRIETSVAKIIDPKDIFDDFPQLLFGITRDKGYIDQDTYKALLQTNKPWRDAVINNRCNTHAKFYLVEGDDVEKSFHSFLNIISKNENKINSIEIQISLTEAQLEKLFDIIKKDSTIIKLSLLNDMTDKFLRQISKLINLESLELKSCYRILNINVLSSLIKLTNLSLQNCFSLENIDNVINFKNLESLSLDDCTRTLDITILSHTLLPKLQNISLEINISNTVTLIENITADETFQRDDLINQQIIENFLKRKFPNIKNLRLTDSWKSIKSYFDLSD